jgi:hypothetical protein
MVRPGMRPRQVGNSTNSSFQAVKLELAVENTGPIALGCLQSLGNGAVWLSHDNCHPEWSRFSGVAKDLPVNRPST